MLAGEDDRHAPPDGWGLVGERATSFNSKPRSTYTTLIICMGLYPQLFQQPLVMAQAFKAMGQLDVSWYIVVADMVDAMSVRAMLLGRRLTDARTNTGDTEKLGVSKVKDKKQIKQSCCATGWSSFQRLWTVDATTTYSCLLWRASCELPLITFTLNAAAVLA